MVMCMFIRDFRSLLERNGMEVFHLRKYIDGILSATSGLELERRWNRNRITDNEEDKLEDMEQDRSKE